MWPFKKSEINYYRVKKLGTKYCIERKLPDDYNWMTLHYWPHDKSYSWYGTMCNRAWQGDSLKEARDKLAEFVPVYFPPVEPDYDY